MSSTLYFLMAITTFLLGLIPHSLSDRVTQELINRVCQQTPDFWDCKNTFNAHLFTDVTNAVGLTEIAIIQTLEYAGDTNIVLQRLSNKEPSTNVRNLYKICITAYGLLSTQFQDANFAFARQDYRSVIFEAEKSERFAKDCQSVLGAKVPQVSTRNKHTDVLVKMSLASAQLIGK